MNTLAERLRYAMEVLPPKKIKGVDLARAVGVKPPSVSDWLSGKSKTMEGENLVKAAKFLGVNALWLASGNGAPISKNTTTQSNDEEAIESLLNKLKINKIPVLNFSNIITWLNKKIVVYPTIYTEYLGSNSSKVFGVIIEENDMEPDFKPKELLIVDTLLKPTPGNFVISRIQDRVIFSKYRVVSESENLFELVPLNEDFPILPSATHNIQIIGVAVQHIKKLI